MARPRTLRINRFTVMAMLQAARARHLGLSEESAYSWGLYRAIWYAAAKRGFRGSPSGSAAGGEGSPPPERTESEYFLGTELGYRDPKSPTLRFTIGGTTQTGAEFRQKIASRFGGEENFRTAWDEAMKIVSEAGEDQLRSQQEFYGRVYRPRRDALVAKWSAAFPPSP